MTAGSTLNVAVVGGGVMGLATAVALAEDGNTVTLIERDRIPSAGGASRGRARIIRLTYADPVYARLARSAFALWDSLAKEAGKSLYQPTGSLDISLDSNAAINAYSTALDAAEITYDLLSAPEVSDRYPQISLPPSATALYQDRSAILHADLCLEALKARAVKLGVDIRCGCGVHALLPHADHVHIITDEGTLNAASVVLAAGQETRALAAALGTELDLEFSREQISFFEPLDRNAHCAGAIPLLIFHLGGGVLSSVFPILRDDPVKLMIENNGRHDLSAEAMNTLKADEIRALIPPLLPNLAGPACATDTCHYIRTPDGNFVIGRIPDNPRIIVCSACSGHGFKFAPVVGQEVARLVADPAAPSHPLFDIGRVVKKHTQPAI